MVILTEVERAQIAWFHFIEGFSPLELSIMFETNPLKVLSCVREFGEWYE